MDERRYDVVAGGHRLEVIERGLRPAYGPTLVFLHEGLGSAAQWRDVPERVHQVTVRVDRLLGRDLLQDDRRHERFEDRVRHGHAYASDLAMEAGEKRMDGEKPRFVVLVAAERWSLRDGPIRAGAPRAHIDKPEVMLDVHRRGAFGRSRGAPDGVAFVAQPWTRPERRKRQRQVEGMARLKPRLGIRDHAKRLVSERHRKGERAAQAGPRLHGQIAFMHARDLSRQPQPESRALHVLSRVDAAESREETGLVLCRYPDALVVHRDQGFAVVAPHVDRDVRA